MHQIEYGVLIQNLIVLTPHFLWYAGLVNAVELLKSIADKYDGVSYADLFQMASGLAVKVCAFLSVPQSCNLTFRKW